jgi:hypothetical protein
MKSDTMRTRRDIQFDFPKFEGRNDSFLDFSLAGIAARNSPAAIEVPEDFVTPQPKQYTNIPNWLIRINPDLEEVAKELQLKIGEFGDLVKQYFDLSAPSVSEDGKQESNRSDAALEFAALQANIYTRLIKGESYPGFESLPHFQELLAFFKEVNNPQAAFDERFKLTDRLIEGTLSSEVIRIMLEEQSFFSKERVLATSFTEMLHREKQTRKLVLEATNSVISSYGHRPDGQHFEKMALGADRILGNSPIIGPDLWSSDTTIPPGEDHPNHPVLTISSSTDRKIADFSFRFGFFEQSSQFSPTEGDVPGKHKFISPYLALDREIFIVFEKLYELDEKLSRAPFQEDQASFQKLPGELALSVLKGLRDLSALGGHDTWHHSYYRLTGSEGNRFTFTSDESYFNRQSPHYKLRDLDSFNLGNYNFYRNDLSAFENHAYLAHRELWDTIRKEKTSITDGIVRRLGNYLDDLYQLKSSLTDICGSEKATNIVHYFTVLGIDQVMLLMPMNDMQDNETLNRVGADLDEAIRKLNLPDFQIDPTSFANIWRKVTSPSKYFDPAISVVLEGHGDDFMLDAVNRNIPRRFDVSLDKVESHREMAPLNALLVRIEAGKPEDAENIIMMLRTSVQRAISGSLESRVALQSTFADAMELVTGNRPVHVPALALTGRDCHLFLKICKNFLDSSGYRSPVPFMDFYQEISSGPSWNIQEMALRDESLDDTSTPDRNCDAQIRTLAKGYLLDSKDGKLTGMAAVLARDFFFEASRLPWIDSFAPYFKPASLIVNLQNLIRTSGVLGTEEWDQILEVYKRDNSKG